MKAWILGSGGMLGQAVLRQLNSAGVPTVGPAERVDITDASRVLSFAGDQRVTHLINCAAYTQVDACEKHEAEATAVNGAGARHVAQAALRLGATALHVSTDYVFDGQASAPYTEAHPCAPLGAYGRSKRAGEEQFLALLGDDPDAAGAARGFVVRTSWLFGHGGSGNFVRTMLRLMQSRPELKVVGDQQGRPTYCEDLAHALLRLGGLVEPPARLPQPGIYHFANGGAVSWHGFAAAILEQAKAAGLPVTCQRVGAITTAEYPTPAKRPAYSVLSTEKIGSALGEAPSPWQQALQAYMKRWVQAPE